MNAEIIEAMKAVIIVINLSLTKRTIYVSI